VTPGALLTNRHPGPINKLLLVVAKLGVVPALQVSGQLNTGNHLYLLCYY
jgi:hypothetical protein